MGLPLRPECHRGVALFSETESVADPAAAAVRDVREMFEDQVASGAKHSLCAVDVMSSGWQFFVERVRPHSVVTITLVEPGGTWPETLEVLDVLVQIDKHLAGRA